MKKWMILLSVGVALTLAFPAVATACSYVFAKESMEINETLQPAAEADFPEPVSLRLDDYGRAQPPERYPHSCAYQGRLGIQIQGYDPDYGLIFEVEGDHSEALRFTGRPYRFPEQRRYTKIWNDRDTYRQDIDIEVRARWVDEYGREGPASEPLRVDMKGVEVPLLKRLKIWFRDFFSALFG